MLQSFSPELVGLLTLALIVLGTLGVLFYQRVIVPRVEESDFWKRWYAVIGVLDDVVTQVVLRLAFSHEDLSEYEQEAKDTGRDVRLVAAIHLIDRFTQEHGVELDEEYIVSQIESKLALLKNNKLVPPGPASAAAEDE